jgi:hypothetical protein
MASSRSPAIRLARRVLLPESELAVADLVDTSVRRRLLSLAPGDNVVVVTIPDGSRGGDPLPVAMLARVGMGMQGNMVLIGERRVLVDKAPRGPSGQAVWRPLDGDDRGGSLPSMREIAALVELSKRVPPEVASSLRTSLGHTTRGRNAVARSVDRCLALPGLGVAFEVQALALVEADVDRRIQFLGTEVRRLMEGKPLDPSLAHAVRAATRGIAAAPDEEPATKGASAFDIALAAGAATASKGKAGKRPPGAVVWGDRYVVEGLLGKGGQGTTWRARDEHSGAIVALKVFDVAKATEWKKLELFDREVDTLRSLSHARIPRLLDVVSHEERRALVMSFVDGSDLDTLLAARAAPFHVDEARAVLVHMLEVLAVLHAKGVVHRDVKPRNIIRSPSSLEHTLVDFGGVTRAKDTAGSTIVGTFGFMAPEQLYGAQSSATDLYALGATVLALSTARQPEDLPRRGLGIDVEAAVPTLPPDMRRALSSMVEPDPDKRAKDAGALMTALSGRMEGVNWWKRLVGVFTRSP